MLTADLAAQRALGQLADTDRQVDAATHQRANLPELAIIAGASRRADDLSERTALAEAEVGDLDLATRKLDDEIESVRRRAQRDEEILASGSASPKEMESLQREIDSLARRQSTLEDQALELMERRETAGEQLDSLRTALTTARREEDAATVRRNDQWADIDDELARLAVQRATLVAAIPPPVIAAYDRVRAMGKIGAAALVGSTCSGCQMVLDRAFLDEIHDVPTDAVPRCPECSTLLIRNTASG